MHLIYELVEQPKMDFNLTGMGEMVELPGLYNAIRSVVHAQVRRQPSRREGKMVQSLLMNPPRGGVYYMGFIDSYLHLRVGKMGEEVTWPVS